MKSLETVIHSDICGGKGKVLWSIWASIPEYHRLGSYKK
jgi:hypothetical protein